jgi:hypothetical protein
MNAAIESEANIYMFPPNGMTLTEKERTAGVLSTKIKFQRSLYGLKQADRLCTSASHPIDCHRLHSLPDRFLSLLPA